MEIDTLLKIMMEKRASDLHIKAGRPPLLRITGNMVATDLERLSPEAVKNLAFSILSGEQQQAFEEKHEIDVGYSVPGLSRFRANIFYQRGTIEIILRSIPFKIPSVDDLGLPEVLKDLALTNFGLVVIAGPTGSGKSTTLAAMIEHINENKESHIITVEDPIEYLHRDKKSTISQREVGFDTLSFANALKYVLRQDPDVILVGELRDQDTARTSLRAAETGHLVLTTLHTYDAPQSVERIISFFSPDEQPQVRMQLSLLLRGVAAQRLLKSTDDLNRVAAVEVMINSPQVQKLIEEGRLSELHDAVAKSVAGYRMQTLNQSLVALTLSGIITEEEAISASTNADEFKRILHDFKAGKVSAATKASTGFDDYMG